MARRRRRRGESTSADSQQVPPYEGGVPGGAIAKWLAEGPLPDWMTIGSYEEFGAGIISGDELPGRLAENHRRRRGGRKPR
jgi:hypothetical protein